MCQMSVLVEKNNKTEKILEDVIKVEIMDNGIMVSTYFEEPKFIDDVRIKEIDCLGSKVTLLNMEKKSHE